MYLLHISPGHTDVAEYFISTSGHPVQIRPRRTVKDAYTLPHPNEVQDQLAGSTNLNLEPTERLLTVASTSGRPG